MKSLKDASTAKALAAKYNECDICGKKLLGLTGWDFYSGVCLEHDIPRLGHASWGMGPEQGRRESRGLYSSEINHLIKAARKATPSGSEVMRAIVELKNLEEAIERRIINYFQPLVDRGNKIAMDARDEDRTIITEIRKRKTKLLADQEAKLRGEGEA